MTIGLIAVFGIMRDLADRGFQTPIAVMQAVRDGTTGASPIDSPGSGASAAVASNLQPAGAPQRAARERDALRADHLAPMAIVLLKHQPWTLWHVKAG